MNKISLLKLFFIFTKIGAILLGGGYVILPILINEFTEKRNLIEYDDLINYFAISQSLPGIIASNISIFIGYKLKGIMGAIIALLGIVFVPFLTILALSAFLSQLTSNLILKNILWGIGIGVIALITLTIRELWQKSSKDFYFYLIFVISLFLLLILNLSPIKTIIISVFIGLLYKHLTINKEAR